MKKRIVILLALLLVCTGLGMVRSEANQSVVIDRDGFYIVDGVLVRYTGELAPGKEIVLPDEVKVIGKEAFSVRNYLNIGDETPLYQKLPEEWKKYYMKLVVPNGVKLVFDSFRDCISLDLYFGEGTKALDNTAKTWSLCRCKVHFPGTLREVKEGAFSGCDNTRIFLNEGLEKIGKGAFELGVTVDNVFPKSLKDIGDKAFQSSCLVGRETEECIIRKEDETFLKAPVLPKGLKSIGNFALNTRIRENTVEYVEIPASVKRIGMSALGGNADGTGNGRYLYKVDKKNKHYSSDKNGWLYSKDKKTLYYAKLDYEHNIIPACVRNIEILSLFTDLNNEDMKRESLKIYFPKKLEKVTRYPGRVYHCAFIFKSKKAPEIIKYKGEAASEYRKAKWLNGDKDKYFLVQKGLKSKFIKNMKLENYPKSRVKEN